MDGLQTRSRLNFLPQREINNEIKTILSSPPQNRTREGIKLATLSLRMAVDTFAEYPIHMQEKLAQVGWYERVIIREGHVPQNFYLILSGTALVTKTSINRQTGEPFVRTAAFLKKGKTFGKAVRTKTSLPSRKSSRDVEFLLPLLQQGPAALEERADTPSPYTSSATVPKEASSTIHVEEDGSQIYIHVQTLKPGDVFVSTVPIAKPVA
ncbi:UNVERIFIED_CONTAM: hypothetical protein FKN15_041657 [Acipenser sinensis]